MSNSSNAGLARVAAIGMVVMTGLFWASAPSAQSGGGGQTSLAIDRDGNVWHAAGGSVRRCHFQQASFQPVCSPWQ